MLNFTTPIDPNAMPVSSAAGEASLRGAAPRMYGNPAVQSHFNNLVRGDMQQNAVELGRANSKMQNAYSQNAATLHDQSALAGLGLASTKKQNATAIAEGQQDISNKWATGLMGMLGGLL